MTTTPVAARRDAPAGGSASNPRARTRLYRDGTCLLRDFPVADISEHLTDPASVVWLDLCRPTAGDFDMINKEFGLHELAVEDAVGESQRPKQAGSRGEHRHGHKRRHRDRRHRERYVVPPDRPD